MITRPFLLGTEREIALENWGSWMSRFFVWSPPQLGFAPAEQRLLLLALRGRTDDKLAGDLELSPSTIKNMWRSIFERVERRFPSLLPSASSTLDGAEVRRGKEKRERLLTYLREHPEDLRPVLRNTVESRR